MFRKILGLILGLAVVAALAPAANLDFNNPTGTQGLIMIDKLGGFVRFFDPMSFKELSSFTIPDGPPHELAISPDHKTAYIPIYGDGVYGRNPHPGHTIAIIDLASKKMTGSIDVSPYLAPHGLQVDSKGTLYVTCDTSRKFLVIDPKTRTITAAIDTEGTGHWIAVLPDGSKAYVANKNDRPFVSVIDIKARKMTGKVDMPNGTQGITVSPDGKRVLAVDYNDPKFVVIDTEPASIHTSSSGDCWERVDSIERVARSSNRAARLLYRATKAGGYSKAISQLFGVRFCGQWRKLRRLQAGCQSGPKESPTKAQTRIRRQCLRRRQVEETGYRLRNRTDKRCHSKRQDLQFFSERLQPSRAMDNVTPAETRSHPRRAVRFLA